MDLQKKLLRSERMDEKPCRKGRKTRASAIWVLPHYQYCQCLFTLFIDSKPQISDIRKSGSEKYKFLVLVCFSESCLRVTETQSTCLKMYFAMSCVAFGIPHFDIFSFRLWKQCLTVAWASKLRLPKNLSKKSESFVIVLSKIFHLPNPIQILYEKTEFEAGWKIRGFSNLTDPNSARRFSSTGKCPLIY